MKVGNYYHLNDCSGWYSKLLEHVKATEESAMALASGCWIVALYNGSSPMLAHDEGIKCYALTCVKRKENVEKVGSYKVSKNEIVYPKFYIYDDYDNYAAICDGHNIVKRIDLNEADEDKVLEFSLSLGGIARNIENGIIDRVTYGMDGWKKST